ncbi:MAG TPA: HEAT repeat domain-containing protein [Gemmatimonadales bacterium]|nr:HEAT repeat domain-containing protein [Gemmatimonadales bacterium]
MAIDTGAVDRALGAIGTTFRLTRLYPASHPAVLEAMRQITTALPALAGLGTVEWKVGATGMMWHGQHLLPRNTQVAELAGLLFARGVRGVQINPGVTPEHWLGLFGVAVGNVAPDDSVLGRITLMLGRRASQRLSASRAALDAPAAAPPPPPTAAEAPAPAPQSPAPDSPAPSSPPAEQPRPSRPIAHVHLPPEGLGVPRTSNVFRPEALPADVEARRAVAALQAATTPDEQRATLEQLRRITPNILALRDIGAIAEIVAGLDRSLGKIQDPEIQEAIGEAAGALADEAIVERMVVRLGEPRVPPAERAHLVHAVGALGAVSAGPVVDAYLHAAPELREAYRAAMRAAGDRTVEPLQARVASKVPEVVAAAAEFLGLSGSPGVTETLIGLTRHSDERVREAALLGLAELGGREISRPAMPGLKDESVLVRTAAARAIAAAGDMAATTVLVRRLEQEKDEGVLATLLKAIGQLGAMEALEVLARYAEPGGRPRRTPFIRAAAIEGLARLDRTEAKALLELYSRDKEPTVKRAAEASLR